MQAGFDSREIPPHTGDGLGRALQQVWKGGSDAAQLRKQLGVVPRRLPGDETTVVRG